MSRYRWDKKPPYATDCILSLDVTPSDRSPSAPPKRNGGLAIKITPKKLQTVILSTATGATMTDVSPTSGKYIPERELLLEKYRP